MGVCVECGVSKSRGSSSTLDTRPLLSRGCTGWTRVSTRAGFEQREDVLTSLRATSLVRIPRRDASPRGVLGEACAGQDSNLRTPTRQRPKRCAVTTWLPALEFEYTSNRLRKYRSVLVRHRFLWRPVRRHDERNVLGVSQLVEFGCLLGQRSVSIRHLEPAASTDEFASWFVHVVTRTPRRVRCPCFESEPL